MSRIGIVVALPAEAKCLYSKKIEIATPVEIGNDLFLCLSGIGYEAARNSSRLLLALKIDALISWGVAGALNASVNPGDLLIAESVIGQEDDYAMSAAWVRHINTHCMKLAYKLRIAPITSTSQPCASAEDKKILHEKTGALAVDMESAAIAEFAKAHYKNMIVLRAIADDVVTSIPETVIKNTDLLGKPKRAAFITSCIKKPEQIPSLFKLARHYKAALKTLKQVAPSLKKQYFLYNG